MDDVAMIKLRTGIVAKCDCSCGAAPGGMIRCRILSTKNSRETYTHRLRPLKISTDILKVNSRSGILYSKLGRSLSKEPHQ